ncbi:hypothetical protein DSO57_1014066 [Entomophthora muscae]|uniref:Uncharacterized protein n=1 Tax=Entomophthora muscae TaxID=34485 RepID=A0ACC2TGC5_9FUNG|nr:hypothetical protein DSO57_1014066 [Entomophthora muscae]
MLNLSFALETMSLLSSGIKRDERYEMGWRNFSLGEAILSVGPVSGLIGKVVFPG